MDIVVKCEQFIVIGCSVSGSRVARQRGRDSFVL